MKRLSPAEDFNATPSLKSGLQLGFDGLRISEQALKIGIEYMRRRRLYRPTAKILETGTSYCLELDGGLQSITLDTRGSRFKAKVSEVIDADSELLYTINGLKDADTGAVRVEAIRQRFGMDEIKETLEFDSFLQLDDCTLPLGEVVDKVRLINSLQPPKTSEVNDYNDY